MERKTDNMTANRTRDEEILEEMTSQMLNLMGKLMVISDRYYAPESNDSIGTIFEGNFEMTLIGGDVVHPKAIQLNDPSYRLGDFGHYFHFRIDKPGKRKIEWGDFEWYTSSPECFTQLKNGNRILRVKMHKDSTEYILENVGKEVKESENVA